MEGTVMSDLRTLVTIAGALIIIGLIIIDVCETIKVRAEAKKTEYHTPEN